MSSIILGWQCPVRVDPHRIQALIEQTTGRYQPLFQDRLEHVGLWNDTQGLMHFDVRADESNLVYVPGQILACLRGKPTAADSQGRITRTTAESLLARRSGTTADTTFIRDVNPPFSFAALDLVRARLLLIHDGLGLDEFFVYRAGNSLVFSNKCWPILRFLNVTPEINIRGWKHWFCMGWFPENETPFEGIQALGRGECLLGDRREIKSLGQDVFSDWLSNPENGDTRHQMVKATEVFNSLIVSSAQRSSSVSADLTGGLDSRAICSAVIANGLNCNFLTGGPARSMDVQIAKRIASQFDLKWDHVVDQRAMGRVSDDEIATSFQKMALWSEGMVEPTHYRHFHSAGASTASGAYLSGGAGEISKAHYYSSDGNNYHPGGSFDRCVRSFLSRMRDVQDSILIRDSAFNLSDDVRVRMNDGQRYALADYELLDYYYLTERARRWKGAHSAASLVDTDVEPFVNIEHVKLAFSLGTQEKSTGGFQRFIIGHNESGLLDIPINEYPDKNGMSGILISAYNHIETARVRRMEENAILKHVARVGSDHFVWQIVSADKFRQLHSRIRRPNDHYALRVLSFDYWYRLFITGRSLASE